MGSWLTLQTLIAFALGVFLATYVKSLLMSAKGKIGG